MERQHRSCQIVSLFASVELISISCHYCMPVQPVLSCRLWHELVLASLKAQIQSSPIGCNTSGSSVPLAVLFSP